MLDLLISFTLQSLASLSPNHPTYFTMTSLSLYCTIPNLGLTLSVLEAANSDLASLINRLDLEATPDSKASHPMSSAITDPTASTRLTLGDPDSPARGGVDDSPLKKAGARARASVTSLRPYSSAQSGSRGKSSGNNVTLREIGSSNKVIVSRAAIPPVPPLLGRPIMPWADLLPKEKDEARAREPSKNTGAEVKSTFPALRRQGRFKMDVNVISPVMEQDSVQPLRPPKYQHQHIGEASANGGAPPAAARAPRIRTSSSELRARAAPFMRTSSVSSTFGSSLVTLNKTTHTHTPSSHNAATPSSHTFGSSRPGPTRYALPSVGFGSSSPRSVTTAGNDTPTPSPRPQRGVEAKGHVRQGSSLVPFVKRVVQSIEAKEALEIEQQQRSEVRLKKRSVSAAATGNTVATADGPSEGLDAEARRELGFKGTMGVAEDDTAEPFNEEDGESDIPDELQIILSQSDDTRTSRIGNLPADAVDDTLSLIPSANVNHRKSVLSTTLPPSPGLPPAAPLPTPSSTPSVIHSPSLEPSPLAPTFLPFLEPSPSPSTSLDVALPITAEAPILTARPVSEDGANEADIDEPYHASSGSEDDTKQSFDFTGELQRLNESGGAHRRSFVEQLENAFKTPSKMGTEALGFELDGFLSVVVGPPAKREHGVRKKGDERDEAPDISMMVESLNESLNLLRPPAPVTSKPSYGRLDTAFKFGGKVHPQSDIDDKVSIMHLFILFLFS